MIAALARLPRFVGALRRDRSGLALMEFAFSFPIIMAVGGWGVELSFYSLTNLRISQYALTLADNASRIGVVAGAVEQLREADINDVLQGTRLEGSSINLTTNGRVTLSSLENVQQSYDTAPVQRLHWQRCIGLMGAVATDIPAYESHYGSNSSTTAGTTTDVSDAGTAMPGGMGDVGRKVNAMAGSGVMFVEINYRYKPAFGSLFMTPKVIHYTASFMVRDNRDYSHIYNPTPTATPSTCDKHAV